MVKLVPVFGAIAKSVPIFATYLRLIMKQLKKKKFQNGPFGGRGGGRKS
jgi:hypothetical protein